MSVMPDTHGRSGGRASCLASDTAANTPMKVLVHAMSAIRCPSWLQRMSLVPKTLIWSSLFGQLGGSRSSSGCRLLSTTRPQIGPLLGRRLRWVSSSLWHATLPFLSMGYTMASPGAGQPALQSYIYRFGCAR